ncbi:MAG: class I SAM-dependent methyltransferase, partial [Pseudomonadota bacterium]
MSDLTPTATKTPSRNYDFYRRRLFDALQRIERGRLVVTENGVVSTFGQTNDQLTSPDTAPEAHITISDPVFYREVVLDGALGAAESYMNDHMRCEDLTALVRLFIINAGALEGIDGAFSAPKRWLRDAFRFLAKNTRRGSKRNIAAHYDLGNDLFRLFLDPSMMYSSAVYPEDTSSLDEASEYK